jgi:hypothetical protein
MKFKLIGLVLVFFAVSAFMMMKARGKKQAVVPKPTSTLEDVQQNVSLSGPPKSFLSSVDDLQLSSEVQSALTKYKEKLDPEERLRFESVLESELRAEMVKAKELTEEAFARLEAKREKTRASYKSSAQAKMMVPRPTGPDKVTLEHHAMIESKIKEGQARAKEMKKKVEDLRVQAEKEKQLSKSRSAIPI